MRRTLRISAWLVGLLLVLLTVRWWLNRNAAPCPALPLDIPPPLELVRGIGPDAHLEAAACAALGERISVTFDQVPLSEVLTQLSQKTSTTLLLDVDTPGAKPDTFVTATAQNIELRALLERIFRPLSLTTIPCGGALLVTHIKAAKCVYVTRVYPVADLVIVTRDGRYDDISADLMELLQTTVATDTWEENGGNGTIDFALSSLSFAVRQTWEVHWQLEDTLLMLREGRKRSHAALKAIGAPGIEAILANYCSPPSVVSFGFSAFMSQLRWSIFGPSQRTRPAEIQKAIARLQEKVRMFCPGPNRNFPA